MSGYEVGDKVLLARGAGAVGVVREPTEVGIEGGYFIETASGTTHFADADQLTLLPPGTPLFGRGGVRVATDAPDHAGRVGVVSSPEFRGVMFGYWINFGAPGDVAWIPAEVLSPLAPSGGESRTGTGELLSVVTADDDATIRVERDHGMRRYSATCSEHGRFFSFCYTPADTRDDHQQFTAYTDLAAAKHAAEQHDTPRVATTREKP